jgi:LacI family transcriptional regulator
VTLAQVAEAAAVSLTTASRALHPTARTVPQPVRNRVQDVAHSLGYVANPHAQSLAGAMTTTLGLLVHDISDPYYAEIAAGVIASSDDHGLLVLTIETRWEPQRVIDALALLRAQRVRAVVIAGSGFDTSSYRRALRAQLSQLQSEGGGVALITDHGVSAHRVLPDNRGGAAALAHTLLGLGHERFAVVSGPPEVRTVRDRLDGFRSTLVDAGIRLNESDVVNGGLTRDGAYHAACALLGRRSPPTALFALTDVMAVAALSALADRGVRVPEDVSIAGFDDVAPLRDVRPALTTVRLPLEQMGIVAVELALGVRRDNSWKVPFEVAVRSSTGPAPARRRPERSA